MPGEDWIQKRLPSCTSPEYSLAIRTVTVSPSMLSMRPTMPSPYITSSSALRFFVSLKVTRTCSPPPPAWRSIQTPPSVTTETTSSRQAPRTIRKVRMEEIINDQWSMFNDECGH